MPSAAATPIPSPSWWPTRWPRSAMILSTLHLFAIPLTLTLALSTPGFAQTQEPGWADRTEPLSVSASYSDAGPYGVLWIAYLAPDGDLSVRVSHRQTSGHTVSQYLASKERVSVLRRAVDEARFFELRNDIAPATQHFHRPHYRLTVTLGARQHSVVLYDPKEVGAADEVRRFFVAWDALFSRLPFKPEAEVVR